MSNHLYTLERYTGLKSRYTCPACGKHKQFTRYVNNDTGEYVADHVGICNRTVKCGHHFTPKQYFQDNPQSVYISQQNCIQAVAKPVYTSVNNTVNTSYLPQEHLEKSVLRTLKGHTNHFVDYLRCLLGKEKTDDLITTFQIGTSTHWPGSTVFWQIDVDRKIRTGKIILYNPITGKRVKKPFPHITWVHTFLLKKQLYTDFHLQQTLFGIHQLYTAPQTKSIGIVESEKSAVIATAFLPELIWMATGSIQNLSSKLLAPLEQRKVILFPDLNGFDLWQQKANRIEQELSIKISVDNLLEQKATDQDRNRGFDIADYLVQNRPAARTL